MKQFDQQKQAITTIHEIFEPLLEGLRTDIVERSTELIYQTEYEAIGRKSREILWFKGYYDLISLAKRLWKKSDNNAVRPEEQMSNLIIEGISHFKGIIVNLERIFKLDLRNTVDFSFVDKYENDLYTSIQMNGSAQMNGTDVNEHKSSAEVTKYAMETIHALLISLGDLHRYFIDFNFNMPKISKDFAANYYFEAFKLNPKTGMAHNQLGTLLSGVNYDLDSVYHYLYSLVCPVPFELSDVNVSKLFQNNAAYLEQIENSDRYDVIGVRDFVARYILTVDVFFYDKDVSNFNALCHCTIVDFRKMLQSKRSDLPSEMLYKMIAILFFCLARLKKLNSNKVHHLNAFLVAICAEMISACTTKLEQFIEDRKQQNERFQLKYGKKFDNFERNVRNARENHKRYFEQTMTKSNENKGTSPTIDSSDGMNGMDTNYKLNGKILPEKLSAESVDFPPHDKIKANFCDDLTGVSSGRERESDAGKLSASSQKGKKKQTNMRRRRKRIASQNSDFESDLSYFEDSGSEYDMDTDFSSDEDSVDEHDSWDSSENEDDANDQPQTEAETESTANVANSPNEVSHICYDIWKKSLIYNYLQGLPVLAAQSVTSNDQSDNEDIVIEEEKIVYLNNNNNDSAEFKGCNTNGDHSDTVFDSFVRNLNRLNICDDVSDEMIIEEDRLLYNSFIDHNRNVGSNSHLSDTTPADTDNKSKAPEKLRYKQKYGKIDPNIVIEFARSENSLKALKILFDWLRINGEILLNCFTTNPEFIDKIFILLNYMNIDIFTRKVFFERELIETENVRENLRSLFDIRTTIPLAEDVLLKEFSIFDQCQHSIDWAMPLKLKITENEETILRVFKFIDFGFGLCKMKKFKYNFCSRSRNFIQLENGKRTSGKRNRRGKRDKRRRRNRSRNRGQGIRSERECIRSVVQTTESSNDDREIGDVEEKKGCLKKGYLKNRHNQNQLVASKLQVDLAGKNGSTVNGKSEIMGKLWLQHEIEVLEAKMSKNHVALTLYLVVDTKALINHLSIVKNLVKAKKFVVLIPKAGKLPKSQRKSISLLSVMFYFFYSIIKFLLKWMS